MTSLFSLAALLVSGLALLLLGIADPKRRRVRGLSSARLPRSFGVALALAPGVALIAAGAWAALFIWIGGTAIIGWAIALLLAPRPAR